MASSDDKSLDIHVFGDVTVVEFKATKGIDDPIAHLVGMDLRAYVQQHGCKKLMFNFRNIEYLSSAALGKLVVLRSMVLTAGATLCFCNVSSRILEALGITGFDRLFKIEPYPDDNTEGVVARLKPPKPSLDGAVSLRQPPSDEDA
jgi:anti-sigma B factor antagonist